MSVLTTAARPGRLALVAVLGVVALLSGLGRAALARADDPLPEDHLVMKSALGLDAQRDIVTLPLHKGRAHGRTVWYVMTDASDFGLARDLNVNFAPKLANVAIGCPTCVQTVTQRSNPKLKFGEADVVFAGAPDFSPRRVLKAGPTGFPAAVAKPGAIGDPRYSPFIRIKGSSVVYNAPIVAVGDHGFDVVHHSNTADRVMAIHRARRLGPGKFSQPSVDILAVKGFDAGQRIFYLSTEASNAPAATLERSTFAPALKKSPFVGADDSLGSARERIFLFANGQTGIDNPQAQGLSHLVLDGHASQDANKGNAGLFEALRKGGDTLNVLGDFPSLDDPRHANAYSPLWDAQVGQWTKTAIDRKLNVRQTDENEILNLVATRPDLITGPKGMPYGSVGFIINCPIVAFQDQLPTVDRVQPGPQAQATK